MNRRRSARRRTWRPSRPEARSNGLTNGPTSSHSGRLDCDQPAASSRVFAEALAAGPARAEARIDPPYWYFSRADARYADAPRYEAARAGILAGTGRGLDAPSPNDPSRAVYLRQALGPLRQELAAWARELERGDLAAVKRVLRALESWIDDFDLVIIVMKRQPLPTLREFG
jgi:hypothetical protein